MTVGLVIGIWVGRADFRTKLLTCGVSQYLQVDYVRIELIVAGVGKKIHAGVGIRIEAWKPAIIIILTVWLTSPSLVNEQMLFFTGLISKKFSWVELCPPQTCEDNEVLTLSTCEQNIIWKWDLCRWNQFKFRSYWSREGRNSMAGILRRRKTGHETHREGNIIWRHRPRLEWCVWKPRMRRIVGNHQRLGRDKEGLSPEPSERAWPWQHLDFRLLTSRTRRG